LLEKKSPPIRKYLTDLVIPTLTNAIIHTFDEKPEDPLRFLASYLLEKTGDVNQFFNRFPSTKSMILDSKKI